MSYLGSLIVIFDGHFWRGVVKREPRVVYT